ncbi:MAG: TIGR03936 family radical SAM-associated protein [Limnochordia bacterium]|jgi:radical SAM-linked protein|nr:TIGR03936 family radical SAM-associated protein [Limnochordia bacterium]MDD2628798.1 TIGR03936 family radical SAM-associated protein [Limnochordia bacterium]MDD4518240.1 TIGR03936 family radical SAM-associated protein [Limnochordia bacterium]
MDIRLKFAVKAPIRHISHLDLLRALTRALRRAQVPVAFSEGFNPHMLLSFGPPLSVGFCSLSEYVDLRLAEDMVPDDLVEALNGQLPKGLRVISAKEKAGGTSLMAAINVADYALFYLPDVPDEVKEQLDQAMSCLMEKSRLSVTRQTKSRIREVDLRPGIFDIHLLSNTAVSELESMMDSPVELGTGWFIRVEIGSQINVRPGEIIQLAGARVGDFLVCRVGLFIKQDGKLRCPLTYASLEAC